MTVFKGISSPASPGGLNTGEAQGADPDVISRPFTRRGIMTGAIAGAALLNHWRALARSSNSVGAFPKGFLWGAATAGHQVEGQNLNSDFWFLEHVKGSIIPDKSGDALDHYQRFADDIKLLAMAGLNTYRFSLEWARIEPEPGEFSAAAIDHYRRVAATCREHGVTPAVTFVHFTTPRWFAFNGGWESAASVDQFARYCAFSAARIGDLAGLVCTMNEPNVQPVVEWGLPSASQAVFSKMQANAAAQSPTGRFSGFIFTDYAKALPNMLAAHQKGYLAIKSAPGNFPVGASLAIVDDQAVGVDSLRDDKRVACYEPWFDVLKRHGDFVGVQTYTRALIDKNGPMKPPSGAELTQTGDEYYPAAVGGTITYAHSRTGLPIYVTENGIATVDDARRVDYIRKALVQVKSCIDRGLPVRGYIHWSLLDNYEWGRYEPKYGLVAVDRSTQTRVAKPSLRALGIIARHNKL